MEIDGQDVPKIIPYDAYDMQARRNQKFWVIQADYQISTWSSGL